MADDPGTVLSQDEPLAGMQYVERFLVTTVELWRFSLRALRVGLRPPWDALEIEHQLYEVGWRSSILVLLVGLALGLMISQFIAASLGDYMATESVIPTQVSRMMFRQLGPLIAGLLVSGRIAAAMTAEIGVLRLQGRVEGPAALAGESERHLLGTRMVACAIAMPILSNLLCFAEILGGYAWAAVSSGTSTALYIGRVFATVTWGDYVMPTLSISLVGIAIAIVSCYFGLTADSSAAGIRRASMQSVVVCCLFAVALNLSLTQLYFVWLPGKTR